MLTNKQKKNITKICSYFLYFAYDLQRLISKLQDVILARVLAPSETKGKKKGKNDRMSQCNCAETLPGQQELHFNLIT